MHRIKRIFPTNSTISNEVKNVRHSCEKTNLSEQSSDSLQRKTKVLSKKIELKQTSNSKLINYTRTTFHCRAICAYHASDIRARTKQVGKVGEGINEFRSHAINHWNRLDEFHSWEACGCRGRSRSGVKGFRSTRLAGWWRGREVAKFSWTWYIFILLPRRRFFLLYFLFFSPPSLLFLLLFNRFFSTLVAYVHRAGTCTGLVAE